MNTCPKISYAQTVYTPGLPIDATFHHSIVFINQHTKFLQHEMEVKPWILLGLVS